MKRLTLLALVLTSFTTISASAAKLDNEQVISLIGDAIFKGATLNDDEARLLINGEDKGTCRVTKSQNDRHFGHVYKIVQNDKIVAYATIWARKSRLEGRIQKLNRELRMLVEIDNGSRSVRSETINLNLKGKRLSMVIAHEFANGTERNVTCSYR